MKVDFSGFVLFLFLSLATQTLGSWNFGSSDKTLLRDVQVLTLYSDRMTAGRRSSAVPQLKCVGGSASSEFQPQVVQCYNRGWDGKDVQWECKTDMDNAYRFGRVEVTCEGYDNTDDPYVLQGSCGLEYTLDYTMEGLNKQKQHHHHDYYGKQQYQKPQTEYYDSNYKNDYYSTQTHKEKHGGMATIILLAVGGVIVYAIYRTCIAPTDQINQRSRTSDDSSDQYPPGGGWHNPSAPPPPGFRSPPPDDDTCHSQSQQQQTGGGGTYYRPRNNTGLGGGGFWSGLFTGGLAGYMFGNRNTYGTTYASPGYASPGYATTRTYASPSFSSAGSSFQSSGTRTASGFGGTRRR